MIERFIDSHVLFLVTSYLITLVLCIFSLCYLVLKSESTPLRTSFAISQTVIIVWLFFVLCEQVSLTLIDIHFNLKCSLICVNFIAPLWLITVLFYTEQLSIKKRPWLIPIILALPFSLSTTLLFPESSDIFRLYIKEINVDKLSHDWGCLAIAANIAALCYVFVSIYFLIIFLFRKKNNSMKILEKISVLIIFSSPIAAHYYWLFIDKTFDLTPLTFSFWGALTVYLSYKRQFFNAIPSLVWNIFNVTKDSMAVLGLDGSVHINKTFATVFGSPGDDFLRFADNLAGGLSGYISQMQDIDGIEAEKDGVNYEISLKNVQGRGNKVIGQLMTISDVSATKQLTLARERARISSSLHDSMGNRLIASTNNLNLALIQPTLEAARPFIDAAATSTTASLMTLRKIVEGLSPVNFNETKLIPMIKSVINRISASGLYIELQTVGDAEILNVHLKEFIYNVCQEALMNTVIHGRADKVFINLKCGDGLLRLEIVDDGQGCENIAKHNGLTTMEKRTKTLGGKIKFASSPLGGFGVYAEFPMKAGDGM